LKAALAAKLEIVDIPIIFSMVLDTAKYNLTAPNMTGITMEVPIERQFTAMRSVLPHLKRIGILYDPAKTGALVDDARRQARALGLDLIARPVQSEKDVPGALRAVLPQVEALWLVPDTTVLTDEALRYILSAPLDHNVPVIGFSSEFVRSGALVGLSVHYGDVGRQAGLLTKKILNGQNFSSIATVPPDRVRLALNLNTAAFLGLTIPPEVVSRADEVY
jgi:putative ABC transport system substrate-binding protein